MRLQTYLNEEWIKLYPNKPKFEVLENPSTREITKLIGRNGEGRFIADRQDKILWLWDSEKGIHQTVYNALEIIGRVIFGEVKMINGKWTMYSSYDMESIMKSRTYEEVIDMMKKFYWLKKYIDIDYYIENKIKEWYRRWDYKPI